MENKPNRKLRIIPILLIGLLFLFPVKMRGETREVTFENLKYRIDTETKEATCTGSALTEIHNLTIPETITINDMAYTVTSIERNAFRYCSGFTGSLIIPNSVTEIGESAFYRCSGFTGSLIIPNSVTEIGESAFSYCSGFTGDLTIPHGVKSIEDQTFSGCEGFNGKLTLPQELQTIGQGAFSRCGFTGSLIIPNSVTEIGESAFSGCSDFTGDLTIPNGMKSIEDYTFSGCEGFNGKLTLPLKLQTIRFRAFYECSGFTGDLIIPNSATEIGSEAFSGCSGFTGDLTISNGVKSIEDYTFFNCSGFTGKLTLPQELQRIGTKAFSGFYSGCRFTGPLIIPNTVIEIGSEAFSGCSDFTGDLTIPNGMKSIESRTFFNCSGFTGKLTLPQELQTIGSRAFCGCRFTGSLIIPNSVTEIGESAFYRCSGFTGDLTIPNGVKSIENGTFYECGGFDGQLILPKTLESIGDAAFEKCSGFTGSLKLPESIESIGTQAFMDCSGFTGDLIIPQKVSKIEWQTFNSCTGFTGSLILPKTLEYIEFAAFANCSGFSGSLILPESINYIGSSAFNSCSGFSGTLNLPQSISKIHSFAFYECYGFCGSLTIPESVTHIGRDAFYACFNLNGVLKIKAKINKIEDNTFSGTNFIELYLSDTIEEIGDCAFNSSNWIKTQPILKIVSPPIYPPIFTGTNFFHKLDYKAFLYVPAESINLYKDAEVWKEFNNIYPIESLNESITLNEQSITLQSGETISLIATLNTSSEDKTITWTSSDPSIAKVDENGLVTAVNVGQAIITAATTNGLKAECEVTVIETEASGIIIDKEAMGIAGDDLKMLVGETKTISVTVEPETTTDKSLTFESSNPEVASVDKEGRITALSLGSTTITITAKSGVSASLNVRVVSTLAGAISLNRNTATLKATETLQLEATVLPETTTDKSVFWTSSDSTVATVDENGLVTTVNVGKATITATTTNGLKAECEVTVIETEASSIVIDKEAMGIEGDDLEMLVGETKTISVTVEPETTTDKSLTFESSNPDVASVDDDGKITALSLGSTTITITAKSGISASLNVRVVSTLAGAISLNRNTATLKATETMLLEATVLPETTTDKSVFWSSSDSSIAKVDGNGLVTAVNVGKATITATTTNGLKAECEVTVVETEATGIVIDKDSMGIEGDDLEMLVGETKTIMVTVEPETATDKSLTFKSSNPDVASVVEEGTIIAISPGRSTVTITAKSGVSTSINVIVTSPIIPVDPVEPVTITVSSQKVREGSLLILAADQPQGGYENGWRWNWLADGEIISDELEFEYTPEMYPGEEQSTETINFTFKATNSNPDGEVFSLIDESTNVTVYRRPSTPKQLLRKGDGTSNTFVTMADKTDKRLQALGYFFVYGYEDIKGDNHILGTTPLRYFHTTRDIYINSNNNFWVYSSWTYPDGSIVTSGKRYLNGLVDEDFDGSSFNINDTRSIDGSNPDNWIKLTAKGIEINVANESDTKIELFDMQGHILKHLIVNGGDNFSLTIGNETLSKGVYIVRVASEKHSVTRKTIIK